MNTAVLYSLIVGFFVSFDEIVLALFVLDRAFITVPRRLWNNITQLATPDPAVIAVSLLLAFFAIGLIGARVLAIVAAHRLRRHK